MRGIFSSKQEDAKVHELVALIKKKIYKGGFICWK
jgi:hypothetical protein